MSPRRSSVGWRWLLPLVACLLVFVLACGGVEDDGSDIVIDLPTPVPLTEAEIRATLVVTLTPPTPTPDVQATRAASLQGTLELWPTLEAREDAPDGYYLSSRDVEYLTIYGPVIWHASRVDLLVSGLYIGYISDNSDLVDFFGQYELVDRPEQWKCHERLRQAVHREMLNLRRVHDALSEYEVGDISRSVNRYATDLRRAVRAADVSGNSFLQIQGQVCAPGFVPGNSRDGEAELRRELHNQIATNTAIFHRLMSGHGCAICGELYRR